MDATNKPIPTIISVASKSIRTSREKLDVIQAMRGIAALAVVLFHFNSQLHLPYIETVTTYGWLGVDVFFVISGFVIPYSLWGRDHTVRQSPAYMLRRLVRIEPPYLASIALILILVFASVPFASRTPDISFAQVAFHVFYAIPLTNEKWLNVVYWSLAYEFVFYVIVGMTFSTLNTRHVAYMLGLTAAIVALKFCITRELDPLIPLFVPGILTMRFLVGIDSKRTFVVCIVFTCALIEWLRPAAGIAAFVAVCLIVALRQHSFPRWTLALGSISYSLYLIHTVIGGRVINLGHRFGDGVAFNALLFVVALAVTLAFAAIFAWAIERPSTKAAHSIR